MALVAWRMLCVFCPLLVLDCDETFNYWEPTHYLQYGYGLQTWEYAPMYGLRSWAYIALHAFFGHFMSYFSRDKVIHSFFLLWSSS